MGTSACAHFHESHRGSALTPKIEILEFTSKIQMYPCKDHNVRHQLYFKSPREFWDKPSGTARDRRGVLSGKQWTEGASYWVIGERKEDSGWLCDASRMGQNHGQGESHT